MEDFTNRFRTIQLRNSETREEFKHHELINNEIAHVDQSNTNDYIYYNFEVSNPPSQYDNKEDPELSNPINTNATSLTFDVTRVEPILNGASSDYEYAVERFSVPSVFPIYLEDKEKYPLMIRIVLRDTATGDILQASENSFVKIYNNPSAFLQPEVPQTKNLISNGIYDYQTIVSGVNQALLVATELFNTIDPMNFYIGDFGTATPVYPFMRYFQQSGNFSLYAPTADSTDNIIFNLGDRFPLTYPFPVDPSNSPVCEIQFNDNLASLFSGLFSWQTTDDGWKTMVFQARPGTIPFEWEGNNYYTNTTQWDVRPSMEKFKKIIFTTDHVPVKDELLAGDNVNNNQRNITQRQLFDYVLSNRLNDKANINFFPQYLKWNNLQSETELRQINMNVYLQYQDDTLYPLKLQTGQIFNCKLLFRKKKTTKVNDVSRKNI